MHNRTTYNFLLIGQNMHTFGCIQYYDVSNLIPFMWLNLCDTTTARAYGMYQSLCITFILYIYNIFNTPVYDDDDDDGTEHRYTWLLNY